MKVEDFEKIKNEIENRKTKKSEAEGQLKQLNKTLKDVYGFDSVKEADKAIEIMEKENDKDNAELDKELENMKVDYDL